jgi:hypothetical protein
MGGCDLQRRFVSHGGLTPPALGCTCVCAPRKSPFHRHAFAHSNRSGGRQPAVGVGKRTCKGASAKSRETAVGVLTGVGAVAAANPRGLTPPAPGERTHIVGDGRLRFATAFCFTRGANAPRSCCIANVCRRKNDFRDARTHIPKSGGRQPAVARWYDRCAVRSECCSATSEHTTKSGGREPAVGESIALATKSDFVVSDDRRHQEP